MSGRQRILAESLASSAALGGDVFDRRAADRRAAQRIVCPERRTGFDRRSRRGRPGVALVDGALSELRRDPLCLGAVLLGTNVLNALDYRATVVALASGNVEGNPIMRALFELDYGVAAFVKLAVIAAATLVIWGSRRYRTVLLAALLSFAVYAALFAYHCYGASHGYL